MLSFNGKQLLVTDTNESECVYKPYGGRESEKFTWTIPKLVLGNLMGLGTKYVEPQGS